MFIIVSEAGKEGDEVQSSIEVTSTITTKNISTAGMPVMDYSEVVDEPFAISLSVTNAKYYVRLFYSHISHSLVAI